MLEIAWLPSVRPRIAVLAAGGERAEREVRTEPHGSAFSAAARAEWPAGVSRSGTLRREV
jgi:hypothetical protein